MLLYAVEELCIPPFVGLNAMGDGVDDICTIIVCHHSIAYLGYCFGESAFTFESNLIFLGVFK